jgi:hypothetical protein
MSTRPLAISKASDQCAFKSSILRSILTRSAIILMLTGRLAIQLFLTLQPGPVDIDARFLNIADSITPVTKSQQPDWEVLIKTIPVHAPSYYTTPRKMKQRAGTAGPTTVPVAYSYFRTAVSPFTSHVRGPSDLLPET